MDVGFNKINLSAGPSLRSAMGNGMGNAAIVAEIDEYLQAPKRVDGIISPWVSTNRGDEIAARWDVVDSGYLERSYVQCTINDLLRTNPSLLLIYRGHPVYRLDLVPTNECKPNPVWAKELDARVCGSHVHSWEDNRQYALRVSGLWRLQARRAVPSGIHSFRAALGFFCDEVNLTLTPEQMSFEPKFDKGLF